MSLQPEIVSRKRQVKDSELHYLTAGQGPVVILLHGYTQTSLMWKRIIPLLAARYTVIAPDLTGIGDSAIPKDGLDMKTAATRIHAQASINLSSQGGIQRWRWTATVEVRLTPAQTLRMEQNGVSIPANIAESFGKPSPAEKARFLNIAEVRSKSAVIT